MRQSEVYELIRQIQTATQKARSNVFETFGGENGVLDKTAQLILGDMYPYLFPEYSGKAFGLLDAVTRMLDKGQEHLNPGDYHNAVYLVQRESLVETVLLFRGIEINGSLFSVWESE